MKSQSLAADNVVLQLNIRHIHPWKSLVKGIQTLRTLPSEVFSAAIVYGLLVTLGVIGFTTGTETSTAKSSTPPRTVAQATATANPCEGFEQADTIHFAACPSFSEDFSKASNALLDTSKFNMYQGAPEANQEAQYYTNNRDNLRIQNGLLLLQAIKQHQSGYNYTSAHIDTKGKEDFLYGKLVVRATLPDGIGTWPAIWMLPTDRKYQDKSPDTDFSRYLNDGEIDLAESVGVEAHTVYGIAHSRAYPADGPDRSYYNSVVIPDNATVFHDYEVSWTPTNLTFSIDDKPFFSIDKKPGADYRSWPFDQRFYLIINLAMGGSWGGEDRADFPADGIDQNALPATLQVQSINYYPYIGK
jgi:beta-glucanase (GH16 family)